MESTNKKRKAERNGSDRGVTKFAKFKKQWGSERRTKQSQGIEPGDVGVWATCAMKKEAKSVGDLRDLFQEYASKLYPEAVGVADEDDEDDPEAGDIEDEINKELAGIRKPQSRQLFESIKLETKCLVFFRVQSPIEPVSFVRAICQDIADGAQPRNLRYVKRLTPITAFDVATSYGLKAVAKVVLAPYFHGPDQRGIKFAIRPSTRNNKELSRDTIIQSVAAIVGPGHQVDLRNYDLLILVEVYQNRIGMSVVGPEFDKLKRFNLEELRQDTSTHGSRPTDLVQSKGAS